MVSVLVDVFHTDTNGEAFAQSNLYATCVQFRVGCRQEDGVVVDHLVEIDVKNRSRQCQLNVLYKAALTLCFCA